MFAPDIVFTFSNSKKKTTFSPKPEIRDEYYTILC